MFNSFNDNSTVDGTDISLLSQKIYVLDDDDLDKDGQVCCCQIMNEDHSLGNALRHILMKDPDVELCGYTVSHPCDESININVQMKKEALKKGKTHLDCIYQGADRLEQICDFLKEKFSQECNISYVKNEPVQIKNEPF